MSSYSLEVIRNNLEAVSILDLPEPEEVPLAQGEALIRVDRFGLTANNITYGVAGDVIGYWQFFPADGDHGRIPVWGIGTVIRAGETGLEEGAEYYGYYPMSSYLVVRPEHVTARGFTDGIEHRAALPPTYNQYSLMNKANGFDRQYDAHRMVYYPLFITGFVLDDWLADNEFFGADRIILSSASSKTSFSLAFLLNGNRNTHVIGLTSAGNKAFVERMAIYDEVVTYDDIEQMEKAKVVFVDMAGNREVLERLHHHFGDEVVYSSGVGITHWESRSGREPSVLPGAKPRMFFAPDQIQKRMQDWGPEKLQQEMQKAWSALLGSVDQWVTINEAAGKDKMVETYKTVLHGAKPDQSYICVV